MTIREGTAHSLALDGGDPVRSGPMPPRIQMGQEELDAVVRSFEQAMHAGGAFDRYVDSSTTLGAAMSTPSEVDVYETALAEYFGVAFVTCVSSGTAALHAALAALDLEPGTEVVCASITDPGAVMPIVLSQCVPVFVEHDPRTGVMSADSIRDAVTEYSGAIMVTHLNGQLCDMDAVIGIAREHGIPVIGDVSQAHGSTYGGSRSAPFGDIGAMSLMSNKHMTSGGQGGMVATNNESYYWKAKRFADRGKPFNLTTPGNVAAGLNYRMTELEAVIGVVQLRRLEEIMRARREITAQIRDGIKDIAGVRPITDAPKVVGNPWRMMVMLGRPISVGAADFATAMTAEGIPCQTLRAGLQYRLPYLERGRPEPFGRRLRGRQITWTQPDHPGVEAVVDNLLLVDIHEHWTQREIDDAVTAFDKVARAYSADGQGVHR